MEKYKERITKQIIKILKKENNIVCIYIFGSFIEGYFNKKSDIDIAILFKNNVKYDEELKIGIKLEEKLGYPIDLINLQRANINLAFRIISKGKLIYEADPIIHSNFLEKIFKEYHDFRPIYIKFMNEFEKSL